jgi:hypothetical protein
MPEDSLISQLANRAKLFHQATDVSQGLMAKAINMTEANYSSFLRKKTRPFSRVYSLLLKFTNMGKKDGIRGEFPFGHRRPAPWAGSASGETVDEEISADLA